jgi:hypothetical protein
VGLAGGDDDPDREEAPDRDRDPVLLRAIGAREHRGEVAHAVLVGGVEQHRQQHAAAGALEEPGEHHGREDDVEGAREAEVADRRQREVPGRPDRAQDQARDQRRPTPEQPRQREAAPAGLLAERAAEDQEQRDHREDVQQGRDAAPVSRPAGRDVDQVGGQLDRDRQADRDRVPDRTDAPAPQPREQTPDLRPAAGQRRDDDCGREGPEGEERDAVWLSEVVRDEGEPAEGERQHDVRYERVTSRDEPEIDRS